jgi:phospholipid/cholesterol/gamma-HCH transport system substrate-binding protein
VIVFVGTHYADLGRLVGVRGSYVVTVRLADASGVFTNAEVTYRGVSVGRVGALNLTSDGVEVELRIRDSSPRIPANAQVVVANRSAVGEQYVDLRPTADTGPYLADGSVIEQGATRVPTPVTTVLTSVDSLAASVPIQSLQTVVDELDTALQGQGPNLQSLLDTTGSLTRAATRDIGPTTRLINDSGTVLATQRDEGDALVSFSRDLRLLAQQLDSSDADLRRLITAAPPAAAQVTGLLRDTDPSLRALLANLLTTADITLTRVDGLEETLVALPAGVAAASTSVTPAGATFGLAVTFFDPLPCTAGYGGTTYRNGLDTRTGTLNTRARCTSPASSGIGVRGSAHAPRGASVAAAPGPTTMGQLLGLPR